MEYAMCCFLYIIFSLNSFVDSDRTNQNIYVSSMVINDNKQLTGSQFQNDGFLSSDWNSKVALDVPDLRNRNNDRNIHLQRVSNMRKSKHQSSHGDIYAGFHLSLSLKGIATGRQEINRQNPANGNNYHDRSHTQSQSLPKGNDPSTVKNWRIWNGSDAAQGDIRQNKSEVTEDTVIGFNQSSIGNINQIEDSYHSSSDRNHLLSKRDVADITFELVDNYFTRPSPSDVHKELLNLYKTRLNYTMTANETMEARFHCMSLLELMFENATDDGNVFCANKWDRYTCWPRTLAGTTASVPCPSYLVGISNSYNATKICQQNGTWTEKASYKMCLPPYGGETLFPPGTELRDEDVRHYTAIRIIYNTGFTLSTLALVIALLIFLYFKSLRCLRNSIHCHLIVTFILNNAIWIIMRHSLIYLQEPQLSWLCRSLTSLYNFAQSTNFFWMFVEGLYLHIIFVWTYSADKIRLVYLIIVGWGLPAINIVAWIIVRTEYENDQCWLPNPEGLSAYDYIYVGPILFVLFANTIFLSTIVWVLITKLRASHTLETRQYRKAVRATVILLPLLGSTYVLFIIPPSDHPTVQTVFQYINAILQSFQGLSVAVFYCFLNGEVRSVLKKKLSRFNDARSLSTKYTRASVGWTRASEFGHSVTYGNGIVVDPNRRPDLPNTQSIENIPLTETGIQK